MKPVLRRIPALVALGILVASLGYVGVHVWRQMAEPASPVAHAIRAVNARVSVGESSANVRLTIEIAGPGAMRESRVPVLPAGVSLVEARLDGERAVVDLVDGRPVLVVRGSGSHTAELFYAVPLAGESRMSLGLPRAIVTSVDLELAKPGCVVQAPPPAIVEMIAAAKGSAAHIVLPPSDRLELAWFPKPVEVVGVERTAARTETLYTIQGDSLAGRTAYSVRVEGKDVARLVFSLPEGMAIDQVEGDWLRSWETSGGRLTVQAASPLAGEHRLVVHHRRPLSGSEVGLEVPTLDGAARQWGFGAVAAGGSVELQELAIEHGSALDPRGLPASLASAGSAPIARAFRYDSVPSKQRLTLVRHPELETLEATCDSLNLLLVRTSDGRSVVKAVYTVRNARRQHLEVKLPDKAEVWSAYVAGKPVRPSGAEGGRVLVPLSCSADTASRGFAVELVYMVPGEPFAAKGRFEAALPEVDIPVMQAMVSVSVPEDVQLEDFGGGLKHVEAFALVIEARDLEQVKKAGQANPTDRDVAEAARVAVQQLEQGLNAQANVRFRNEALDNNDKFQKAIRGNWTNRAFIRQYYLENSAKAAAPGSSTAAADGAGARLNLTGFGQEELAEITGLASLSIAVPSGGRVYRFERQLLIGEGARVEADYWSELAERTQGNAAVRLSARSATLYRLSQRGLAVSASLRYSLDSGKVDELRCELPSGAKALSVSGGNVAGWEVRDGRLEVRLVRPERAGGSLLVTAEAPAAAGARAEYGLAPVRLAGARSDDSIVAVAAPAEFELDFPGADELERLAPKALPPELLAGGGERRLSVFRLGAANASGIRVKAVRHQSVAALQATCDSVNAISFWTEEGAAMTRAIYEIRNVSQQNLEIVLPEGAKLWGAFVADRPVKPLAGEGGGILLPLEVSPDGQVRSFPVEVVYLLAGRAFERRGAFAAELPRVNVPVMHAMYSLYLPKRLRLGDFTGTLKPVKEFSASAVPAPAPQPAAGGARPGADAEALAAIRREAMVRNARYQERQQALEANLGEEELARLVERAASPAKGGAGAGAGSLAAAEPEALGGCGLKIYIPAVGQMLRFERHLVVEGKMSVGCGYRL